MNRWLMQLKTVRRVGRNVNLAKKVNEFVSPILPGGPRETWVDSRSLRLNETSLWRERGSLLIAPKG